MKTLTRIRPGVWIAGLIVLLAVAWALETRHPTTLFRIWLFGEILICAIRFVVLIVSLGSVLADDPTVARLEAVVAERLRTCRRRYPLVGGTAAGRPE